MYKSLLREYRRLQSELSPWMQAFEVKNGHRPRLADVEATQITWLNSNFKHYLLLRDKLLRDIPYLRTTMVTAPKDAADVESNDIFEVSATDPTRAEEASSSLCKFCFDFGFACDCFSCSSIGPDGDVG